jgi:hypothetical protein
MFHPSPANVTTIQHFQENTKLSKSFVYVHRDGIPLEDLASFSCTDAGTSLPTTESISTVFTTAGSLSLSPFFARLRMRFYERTSLDKSGNFS